MIDESGGAADANNLDVLVRHWRILGGNGGGLVGFWQHFPLQFFGNRSCDLASQSPSEVKGDWKNKQVWLKVILINLVV